MNLDELPEKMMDGGRCVLMCPDVSVLLKCVENCWMAAQWRHHGSCTKTTCIELVYNRCGTSKCNRSCLPLFAFHLQRTPNATGFVLVVWQLNLGKLQLRNLVVKTYRCGKMWQIMQFESHLPRTSWAETNLRLQVSLALVLSSIQSDCDRQKAADGIV